MTLKPLDPAFPLASDLSERGPRAVPVDEHLLELETELERRAKTFPRLIERGTLTEADARSHNHAWRALIADHKGEAHDVDWETRIRELRRELALRRNAWPKWAASATHPLTPHDARLRSERLDAIHWHYWCGLWRFSLLSPADDHRRHAVAARREIMRRMAGWSAAKAGDDMAATTAAIADERAWRAIEIFAQLRAGIATDYQMPPVAADVAVMADAATDRLEALLALPTSDDSEALIAQLAPLTRWLEREALLRTPVDRPKQRIAA